MAEPKIVNMQRTEAEKAKAEEACKAMPCDGPDYPWGLCLNLGKDELAKLGITELPKVGDEFHIYGVACVTRVSQSASQDTGEDSKSVELQVTALGVMQEDESGGGSAFEKTAGKLYGAAEKAEGE